MSHVLLDPVMIASLEEERMALVMREVSAEFADINGYACGFGGPGSWQNQAIPPAYTGEPDREAIERVDAFYVERGVVPQINVSPHIHPGLLEHLNQAGYRPKDVELVYAIDLEAQALPDVTMPEGIAFERVDVRDPARVEAWAQFNTRIFFGTPEEAVHVEAAKRCVHIARATSIIATSDERDIGVAGFEVFGELAALWGAAIDEGYRRRGVQLAMIIERLRLSKEAGCRYATIASSPTVGTERNAIRAGMRLVYPRLEMVRLGDGLTPGA